MLQSLKKIIIRLLLIVNKSNWVENKPKVLIQTNKFGFSKEKWERVLSEDKSFREQFEVQFSQSKIEFIKLSEEANIIFCFGQNPNVNWNRESLKLVYFGLNGIEFLDKTKFHQHTIIDYVKGFAAEPIAEYVLSTVLLLNRKLTTVFYNKLSKNWNQKEIISDTYIPIKEKVVGVLGVGIIGSVVAEKFSNIGCKVYGYDIAISSTNKYIDEWFSNESVNSFIKEVDVLIITLPLNSNTLGLLNSERLGLLKKRAIIVNVSRSEILDQKALIKRIKRDDLYAVLDVFDKEPLSKNNKLWGEENVILTPHIAGNVNIIAEEVQIDFINKCKKTDV